MMPRVALRLFTATLLLTLAGPAVKAADSPTFAGRHYRGVGDVEYLEFLDTAARMFAPDPALQNLSMLYTPAWNGLVEGPTWDAWWVQNSYGTTYAALPLLQEPFVTFLQNSQDLWFDQMGDGQREGHEGWVAPDGSLCDAARPGLIYYKQGDGQTKIHDWGMEFTAAGVVMQAELLLIAHDKAATARYLPKLERSINFIESRRDPKNNLFLAGPAGNLLAPSFAGHKKPDGTYGQAYLTGLSVTYIAALDRMIELETFMARDVVAADYRKRRDSARLGLDQLKTDEGYFVMSMDPDGTKHGVHGAAKHGYFETPPNHDAIAFRVVDDAQARQIYDKIASIPQLRPHGFVIPNYPSYDDMYEPPHGLWAHGTWVNGGHWSTCEARMMLAYARLGKHEDQKVSMRQLMKFARAFRMDNPLTNFGDSVYQPNQPINLCYDTFGPAAGLRRGLFEYIYKADRLILVPHVPPGITELHQVDPVRFGHKKLYLSTRGTGDIAEVLLNGTRLDVPPASAEISLPYDALPEESRIVIVFGNGDGVGTAAQPLPPPGAAPFPPELEGMRTRLEAVERFAKSLPPESYEAAHARLIGEAAAVTGRRWQMASEGKLAPLPPESQKAADESYVATVTRLLDGLEKTLDGYKASPDAARQQIHAAWAAARS
jgi:hypothetical protein